MLKIEEAVSAVLEAVEKTINADEFKLWHDKANIICRDFAEGVSERVLSLFGRTKSNYIPALEIVIWWDGEGIFTDDDTGLWVGIPEDDQIGVLLLNHPRPEMLAEAPPQDVEEYGLIRYRLLFCSDDRAVLWNEQKKVVVRETNYEGAIWITSCWLVQRIAEMAMHYPKLFPQLAGISDRIASIL